MARFLRAPWQRFQRLAARSRQLVERLRTGYQDYRERGTRHGNRNAWVLFILLAIPVYIFGVMLVSAVEEGNKAAFNEEWGDPYLGAVTVHGNAFAVDYATTPVLEVSVRARDGSIFWGIMHQQEAREITALPVWHSSSTGQYVVQGLLDNYGRKTGAPSPSGSQGLVMLVMFIVLVICGVVCAGWAGLVNERYEYHHRRQARYAW